MAAAAALTTQLDSPRRKYVSANPHVLALIPGTLGLRDSSVRTGRQPAWASSPGAGMEIKESGPGGGQRRNEEPVSLGDTPRGARIFLDSEDTEARQGSRKGERGRKMERGESERTPSEGRESTSSESSICMGPANQTGRERPRPEEPKELAPSRESSPTSELEMRLWRTPRHPADEVSVFGFGLGLWFKV